jgi:hypothetical protein
MFYNVALEITTTITCSKATLATTAHPIRQTTGGVDGGYTVKKAQWNFQLDNHVTFHLTGIKIVYNIKIIYINADIKINSIEFTGFYIVHNVI